MREFVFPVDLVPDEDAWHVEVPGLVHQGAATWGRTREEALQHMQEVMEMLVEVWLEEGDEVPELEIAPGHPTVTVRVEPE